MSVGTRSLLFGVHQILLHPLQVLLAWVHLYQERPNCREMLCIIIHDWGYFGKNQMNNGDGDSHPEAAYRAASRIGLEYGQLCLYHSRHYAYRHGEPPSKLCWADKLSILWDPWWLYLPRAWLSGELVQYRHDAVAGLGVPLTATHREWYRVYRSYITAVTRKNVLTFRERMIS